MEWMTVGIVCAREINGIVVVELFKMERSCRGVVTLLPSECRVVDGIVFLDKCELSDS